MPGKPNIVIFFTDQQRWDGASLHGNPLDLMPNFERIARRGTHLANAISCQPVCGPARACLQTGTYASTNRVWRNGLGMPQIPEHLPRMAELFNAAGYRTGYIGKWHLAGPTGYASADGERGPVAAHARGGWKHWLAVEALEFSVDEYHAILYDSDNRAVALPGYRVDAVADAGIRFIDTHPSDPFVLMMSFVEPHHQNDKDDYPPPDGYRERYAGRWTPPDLAALPAWATTQGHDDAPCYGQTGGTTQQHLGGYWGMVKRLDEAFGRVLDAIRSLGLEDDTLVLFASDHGCHFKTRNAECKRSCHESSVHVPAAMIGGPFTGGGRIEQPVSLVDLPPTLLDAAGIDVPDAMQGRSILPLLRGGDADWPEEAFIQISESHTGRAVRTGRWKYAVAAPPDAEDGAGAASRYEEAFVYDLKHDPYELCNLVGFESHSEVRRVMRQRLLRRMTEAGEPTPTIIEAPTRQAGQRHVKGHEAHQ
ncbi:MAG: sulfatase-like hydrolase/transferase [Alphaproteobacteria bacterium]|nr:sulfatase-like hydrolase/transferase [Alphaproteobacteria bacterium]